MDRIILHSDCDNFFASVETVLNPDLKDVPMAVAGDKERRHGIILAKNQLAKKYGIKTAEPIWQAQIKCPGLVLVPPHHSLYKKYSKRINEIYISYTDLVEKFSIDESWLDVTGSVRLFGDGREIADTIRMRVRDELGITVSIGVSFNKIFAKLGSDYDKPNGTTVITRENYERILYPLPVENMIFVGKKSCEVLKSCNIKTIGDLAAANEELLEKKIGSTAHMLVRYARGEDNEPVLPYYYEHDPKSIGKGMTFQRNLLGEDDVAQGIYALSDDIATKMRKRDLRCATVQVQIRDITLKTIRRQRTLDSPTYLTKEIFDAAMALIRENWNMGNPIRMITVTAANITRDKSGGQVSLFDDVEKNEKHEKLELAIDKIRGEFGKGSITNARILRNDLGIDLGKNVDDED